MHVTVYPNQVLGIYPDSGYSTFLVVEPDIRKLENYLAQEKCLNWDKNRKLKIKSL